VKLTTHHQLAEVKNAWSHTSTPPLILHCEVFYIYVEHTEIKKEPLISGNLKDKDEMGDNFKEMKEESSGLI
jgi:hypothetical protein